ncbi:hypothetical protein F5146DRAFT_758071 [Armillaria mellea]|nr:hypothetical protein F5146DRAFT_758071 [Armillaria mellea]
MPIFWGVLGAALLLTVAYEVLWPDTPPPQQHRPVYQPPTPPPPSPQRHRSPPYTRLVHQDQPIYQPPSPHSPPPLQSYRSSLHAPPRNEDDDQNDQPNEYYLVLRARANKEGDEMEKCFNESREAYSRGNRTAAKDLSNQGKFHKQKMEQLNKDASDWIFYENNRDCRPGEVDLHRLRVKEAIARTDIVLEEARLRGDSEIRLIVGKGLHSEGGEVRVGPAIKGLMRKYVGIPSASNQSSTNLIRTDTS